MAWTSPRTWVTSEVVTASIMNTHVRDNLLETAPAKVTTKGDILAATAANAITRVPVGATLGNPLVANSACSAGVAFDSSMSISGSKIGLGTSSPSATLQIRYAQSGSSDDALILDNSSGAVTQAAGMQFVRQNDTRAAIRADYFNGLMFLTKSGSAGTLTEQMRVGDAGAVYIGDTGNASMTAGLTINQAGNDNEILTLKSSDVGHSYTTVTEADTYGLMKKVVAASGALDIQGFGTSGRGLRLTGYGAQDSNRSTTATAQVEIYGANATTNNNLLGILSPGTLMRLLVDAEGDLHADAAVSASAYDAYHDAALLRALDVQISDPSTIIEDQFTEWMKYGRDALERARLVTFNPDGHHFVNYTKTIRLLIGNAWQQEVKLMAQAEEIARLRFALDRVVSRLSSGSAPALPAPG